MWTLVKWFATLVAGIVLIGFGLLGWLEWRHRDVPTPTQERSALYLGLKAALDQDSRMNLDVTPAVARQLVPGLPRYLAQATLAGAGFRCDPGVPQHCALVLNRSLIGYRSVSLTVRYVDDEVRSVQAVAGGTYL